MLDYEVTLEDLKEVDEDSYKSFIQLLNNNDENLEENLGVTFTTYVSKFGEQKLVLLKVWKAFNFTKTKGRRRPNIH